MVDRLRNHVWAIALATAIVVGLVVVAITLGPFTSIIAAAGVLFAAAAVALIAGIEKHLVNAITAVAAIVTVIGVVPTVAEYKDYLPSRSRPPSQAAPTTTAPALPYGCQGPADKPVRTAEVATSGGSGADRFSFSAVHYSLRLDTERQLFLAAAGHVQGALPSGRQLYLLGAAKKTTVDEFGNPGTGFFFPQQRLTQGCWQLNQRRMGHPRACGLTYRYFIASVPDRVADEFDQYKEVHDRDPARRNDGFTQGRLDQHRVEQLGFFDVPTKELC